MENVTTSYYFTHNVLSVRARVAQNRGSYSSKPTVGVHGVMTANEYSSTKVAMIISYSIGVAKDTLGSEGFAPAAAEDDKLPTSHLIHREIMKGFHNPWLTWFTPL